MYHQAIPPSIQQFENTSSSPAFWKRQLNNFLSHQNKQAQPWNTFVRKWPYEFLQASAPTLVQCIENYMTESQRQVSEVFALLKLQESLMQNIPQPFIQIFDYNLDDVVPMLYKKFPQPAKNDFIVNYFQVLYQYFPHPKLTKIYARCMEILRSEELEQKSEALERQLNDTTEKLQIAESQIQNLEAVQQGKQSAIESKIKEIEILKSSKSAINFEQLKSESESTDKEIATLKSLVQETKNSCEQLKSEKELKDKEIETLKLLVQETKHSYEQLKSECDSKDKEIQVLKEKVKQAPKRSFGIGKDKSLIMEMENSHLKQQNERLEHEIEGLLKANHLKDFESASETDHKIQVSRLQSQIDELQMSIKAYKATIKGKDKESAKLKTEVQNLKTKIEVQVANLSILKERVDKIPKLSSQIQMESASIIDELFLLREKVQEIPELLSQIQTQAQTISEKEKEIAELKEKHKDFLAQTITDQNNDVNKFQPKTKIKIENQSNEINCIQLQTREHEQKIEIRRRNIISQFRQLKDDNANLKLQNKEQDKKICKLEEINERKGEELAHLKEEILKLELEIKNLKDEITANKTDFSDLKNKLSLKNTLVTSKDLEIELLNHEIADKTAENKRQRSVAYQANEELEANQNKLQQNEKELEVHIAEIKSLQRNMETKDTRIAELQDQANNHNRKIESILSIIRNGSITVRKLSNDIRNEIEKDLVVEILDSDTTDTEENDYVNQTRHSSCSSATASSRRSRKRARKTDPAW